MEPKQHAAIITTVIFMESICANATILARSGCGMSCISGRGSCEWRTPTSTMETVMHDQIATDMIMTLKEEVANLNREINELAEEKNARIMELEEGLVNLATWTEDNCDKGVYLRTIPQRTSDIQR